jgi:hypothetical protein
VHIVFQDQRGAHHEIYYTKLDPALDDQNGDVADAATITVIDDTALTADDGNKSRHPAISAGDDGDQIHIIWEESSGPDIYYMALDTNGNTLVSGTALTNSTVTSTAYSTVPNLDMENNKAHIVWCDGRNGNYDIYYTSYQRSATEQGLQIRVTYSQARADQPDVAIDSNGNTHIVYCDDYNTGSREIWYTMLDSTGSTLIDDTRLTDDDGYDSTRPGIIIDSSNKVHITFRDWQWDLGSSHEVTYTKLDPSLDDRNGDAADAATITAVGITALTPDDGYKSRHPAIASSGNGQQIHITWEESEDPDGPNIHYLILDTNGNTLVSETALTTDETAEPTTYWTIPYLDVDADGKAHIVWSDYRHGENEVYYTTYQGPAPDPNLNADGGGGGGGGGG